MLKKQTMRRKNQQTDSCVFTGGYISTATLPYNYIKDTDIWADNKISMYVDGYISKVQQQQTNRYYE